MNSSGFKFKGEFRAWNACDPIPDYTHNQVTYRAQQSVLTALCRPQLILVTNLMFLHDFSYAVPPMEIEFRHIEPYIAKYSTLANRDNQNPDFRAIEDERDLVFQVDIPRQTPVTASYNAAALVMAGNTGSNLEEVYGKTGVEEVFSIVTFDEIKKASWSDFIADWRIKCII